jgi:ABC-type lipoprotein release transport system permease subunit
MRSTVVLRVCAYRFVTTFRRQWGAGLTIVILIGLVSGVGLGALSGARRTQTSFSTFFASTNPSDLGVAAFTPRPHDFTKALQQLPSVRSVSTYVTMSGEILRSNESPLQLQPKISVVGSTGQEFFTKDRFTVTQGRAANPRMGDETMLSASAAQILRLHVGAHFTIGIASSQSNAIAQRVHLTVVGIGYLNSQIVQDDVERLPTYIVLTPALTKTLTNVETERWYELALVGGRRSVPAVENEVFKAARAYLVFHASSISVDEAILAIRPDAAALWVFGAIATLVGLLLALQAIARLLHSRDTDLRVLRALGANTLMTDADGLIGALGAIVVGALLAVVVCVALSPLSPIGPARTVYPTPGLYFDWTVIGLGLLGLLVVLGSLTVAIAVRNAPHRTVARRQRVRRASPVVRTVARSGLPTSASIGVRFALESGGRDRSITVRSALYGAVLAILMVTTTLTFASGLSTLVSHPSLYGWNWNSAIDSSDGYGPIPPSAQAALNHDPFVASWSGVTFFAMQLDGVTVPILFSDAPAAVSPPILAGHALAVKDQIVLGPATLALLHKSIGEQVTASYGPVGLAPSRVLTIVGTATMPAIGISAGLHTSMGIGALVPNAAFVQFSEHGYPKACNGPNFAYIRFRPGVSHRVATASLQKIDKTANHTFGNFNNGCGLYLSVLGVQKPGPIRDYGSVGVSPGVLAGGLAGGAVIALGFTLVASVRRRRRELALLKALGFTQRQLRVAVAWQASVVAVVGVVVGVPLGIALGRWLWILFAREVFAVPRPTVPIGSIILVALGALLLTNVVAALPGRSAARTKTALVLRAE